MKGQWSKPDHFLVVLIDLYPKSPVIGRNEKSPIVTWTTGLKSVIGITTAMCYDKIMVVVIPHYGRYVKLPNLKEGGLHNYEKDVHHRWG